jgi:hypothetical protein
MQADPTSLRGIRLTELPSVLSQAAGQVLSQGSREARIQLDPPELGALQIRISLQGDRVTARISAERLEVRAMLEGMKHELQAGMDRAGLHLEKLEIQAPGSGFSAAAHHAATPPPLGWTGGSAAATAGMDARAANPGGLGGGNASPSGQPSGQGGRGQTGVPWDGRSSSPEETSGSAAGRTAPQRRSGARQGVDLWA